MKKKIEGKWCLTNEYIYVEVINNIRMEISTT